MEMKKSKPSDQSQNGAQEEVDAYIASERADCKLRFIVRVAIAQIVGAVGIVLLILGILERIPLKYGIIVLTSYTLTFLSAVIFHSLTMRYIEKVRQVLIEKLERDDE